MREIPPSHIGVSHPLITPQGQSLDGDFNDIDAGHISTSNDQ